MSKIALLSQETIDKIAAGEVVERPSSVVKELVENAIDAGASAITVEIKEGGISLIRITDNGCGIPKEEVPLAFLRHSTSKIRSAEDLMCVHSLGFRGEALSSIAAVSRVEMITKPADALTGTRYVIEGSKEIADEEIGAPDGTTFLVRDLFYNTPARRKFLKTAQTEGTYISDMLEKLALSHPDISFKYINNNQTRLHTSGNGKKRDLIFCNSVTGKLDRQFLEGSTDFQYISQILLCNPCNLCTFSRDHHNKAFQLQLTNCFTDRCSADSQLVGQCNLHQTFSRFQFSFENRSSQCIKYKIS